MNKIINMNINKPSQTRREFIKDTLGKASIIALGSYTISFLTACSDDDTDGVVAPKSGKGEITIDITKPENNALENVGGTIAISGNSIDNSGMLIIRNTQNTVTVLSRYCTHQGCTVSNFKNDVSSCPCHGSKFDTSGNVTKGPATKSLKKYSATISGSIITIEN